MSEQEKFLLLVKKLHPKYFQELRSDRYFKHRTQDFDSLKKAIIEKSQEDWVERNLINQKKQLLQPLSEVPPRVSTSPPQGPSTNVPKSDPKQMSKPFGKGKGQGKGQNRSSNMPPKPKGEPEPPRFSVSLTCKFCQRKGHYEDQCWRKKRAEIQARKKGPKPTSPKPEFSKPIEESSSKKRKADAISILQGKQKTY